MSWTLWCLTKHGFGYLLTGSIHPLPLFAGIAGAIINNSIKLCTEVIKFSIVTKCSPLHVNTHLTFITLQQLNVVHFFHVADISSCACQEQWTVVVIMSSNIIKSAASESHTDTKESEKTYLQWVPPHIWDPHNHRSSWFQLCHSPQPQSSGQIPRRH